MDGDSSNRQEPVRPHHSRASPRAARAGRARQRVPLGDVVIDFGTRRVITRRGDGVPLTPKEFNLLGYLVAHANTVLSDRELLQAAWGPECGIEHDRLRVVVRQLRKKIEVEPSRPVHLRTVSHVGYQLDVPRWTGAPDVTRSGGRFLSDRRFNWRSPR